MYLALDTKFNPFTYAEMVQPLLYYKDAYEKTEAAYSDLASQTEAWKDIANQQNSPEAYAMYKKYSDDLNRVVDDFSRGMTAGNRRQLLNMKRRYAKEISPIERASAALDEAIRYRQETASKDPTAVFVQNYSSIDDFLHGKRANNEFVSGKDLMTRVAAKAEGMGKALFSDPQFKKILGGQKYQAMIANGYTPEMLLQVMQNDPDASPYLTQIYKGELESIGLDRFNELDQAKLINAAQTGMYAGLQKPTVQFIENGEYMNAAQRDASARGWADIKLQQQELAERKAERQDKEAIASGQKPFATDPDGTQHFTNGVNYWTVKDGVRSNLQPVSKGGIAAAQEETPKKDPNDPRPKELMAPLYFDALYNDTSSGLDYKSSWDGNIDEASRQLIYSKGKHVSGSGVPNKLSTKALSDIRGKLPKGMSLSDVDVYVDHDTWGDSHYIVVDARGDILGREKVEGPVTPTSGSKGSQSAGM